MMRALNILCLAFMFGNLLTSCYTRELYYSFEPSSGGVTAGESYYYLAQVREYRMPKGISRFPDGGMSKETRQVFGLFRTDSIQNKTFLIYTMPNIYGWPVRYSTRFDKNESFIVFGISNVSYPDSLDGIYLFNLKSNVVKKFSSNKALPTISDLGQIAYCVENKLSIDDIDGTNLFSYILNEKPVFVDWKNTGEIYIFNSNPFRVQVIVLSTGKTTLTNNDYLSNYGQGIKKSDIIKVFNSSSPDLKGFLK